MNGDNFFNLEILERSSIDTSISAPNKADCLTVDNATRGVLCHFTNLVVDPTKMIMDRNGGEALYEKGIMGQSQEKEFIQSYLDGAFWLMRLQSSSKEEKEKQSKMTVARGMISLRELFVYCP